MTPSILESVMESAKAANLEVLDSAVLSGHAATFAPVPGCLEPAVADLIRGMHPRGLYAHQTQAIERVLHGDDVCLATATASGKSLVFQAAAADLLKRDGSARVIALYPAKALIQDQLSKWRSILRPLGFEPGYVDGGVPTEMRPRILQEHRVVLMTPDVAHAWLMSHLNAGEVSVFMANLKLLVLDEAHVYDGVFGTNMAYFLRRLQAVAGAIRIIASTATIGLPAEFLLKLTGRTPTVFGGAEDGSFVPSKTVVLARTHGGKPFEAMVSLLRDLARGRAGRFLAFADSRKMVEQLVAGVGRSHDASGGRQSVDDEDGAEGAPTESSPPNILPYRAGYEEEDRQAIQRALGQGDLAGVVSTSALELGLDIGEINLVVLLGTPPSVKAFWQRMGRAGRRQEGVCLLIDDHLSISSSSGGLRAYLERPPERGWLYLDNRYIQFANALCAASEASETGPGVYSREPYSSLPEQFVRFFENELDPKESIPEELYPLKQRSQAGPHYEFPLRSGTEKDFTVRGLAGPANARLGTLSFSQVLREAYPGAVYYYMARPYQVTDIRYRTGEIFARLSKRHTTRPQIQNKVFPKFQGGLLQLLSAGKAFVAEVEVQVSERVIGFIIQRGPTQESHLYGPASPYSQKPLTRFFATTGVCLCFPDRRFLSDDVSRILVKAFCDLCGVEARDLGIGQFFSLTCPSGEAQCQGLCVYDATHGSLRLTQQFVEHLDEIIALAIAMQCASDAPEHSVLGSLEDLREQVRAMRSGPVDGTPMRDQRDDARATVIAPGESAMVLGPAAAREVQIVDYRYTPQGLMYQLHDEDPGVRRMVSASSVVPINGMTKMLRVDFFTGDVAPVT
jgi:DEAD/DEAH box helicase domain-containing protein